MYLLVKDGSFRSCEFRLGFEGAGGHQVINDGVTMRHRMNDEGTWVDLYSERCFGGRLRRLRPGLVNGSTTYDATQLSPIQSIIVGPKAVVTIVPADGKEPIRLLPKTILADTAHFGTARQKMKLVLESSGAR